MKKNPMFYCNFFLDFGTYCLYMTILGIILSIWRIYYQGMQDNLEGIINSILFLIINAWATAIIIIIIYEKYIRPLKEEIRNEKTNKTKH